ncbi:EAL domain-containing protein [Noviherbaspirillum suwonense]|uniref:PAS domain S-box-containing protein/diguanylate cyclase (GGDEF) domain-containing protein n=1 Tax=Noviherbaspirillum suwonense TaxID=1224511 RepID=A0ABY1Q6A6_9BURK|nr:EAL domain-containing protein [Noviherbaspirillum suwonense]SMP57813.1 PAS domain S-box-containing protein/diguanylate cyclase (GGDEF) domain-containing protein [Noviherbaspirillum suwonense]
MQHYFARLIGGLSVGRKLSLIYLLDLTAVIFVSGILINEKYIAIDFTQKEINGGHYIAAISRNLVPLAQDLSHLQRQPPARTTLDVDGLRVAEASFGGALDTAALNRAFTAALAGPAGGDAAFDAGRALLTRVGNQSNLILDPDLDSYYTMSLVLLRFPELLGLLRETAQLAEHLQRHPEPDASSRALLLEGRLDASVQGIDSDYEEAFSASKPELRQRLSPSRAALRDALTRFREASRSLGAGTDGEVAALERQRVAAVDALARAWTAAQDDLQRLLALRKAEAYARMWMHLGTAALLLMVILSVVFFVARQISKPISRLARVAAKVSDSGDYSLRAEWNSTDEIGRLVRGFNGMLEQLDRQRISQQELVARHRAADAQRELVEAIPIPMMVTSIPLHDVLHANQAAESWLNGRKTDPWSVGMQAETRARFFQGLTDTEAVDQFEVCWRGGRTPSWALVSARCIVYQGQRAVLTTFTPINQMKLMEQRLELWARVFEASSEGIMIIDPQGRIVDVNRAVCRGANLDLDDLLGMNPRFLLGSGNPDGFFADITDAALNLGSWQGEAWLKRKGREPYPAWLVLNAVRDAQGQVSHYIAITLDISERKKNEQRIAYMAQHDALTGLPNRSLCQERLQLSIDQAKRSGQRVAVLFVDLDRFKNINDSLGHHVGDGLLRSISSRLLNVVRNGDTVARLGGDEFVVILNGITAVEEIGKIVDQRLISQIRRPHHVDGAELHISCSVGVAVYPDDGSDIDRLMRHADVAMYQAKNSGRDNLQFFTPELNERVLRRLQLENDLRHAVERDELVLYYQPRIDARTGALAGVESLVRWMHPQRGLIPPADFIPIAEESGLIVGIGAWIIAEACSQHRHWRRAGIGAVPVSINLSAVQLREPGLCATLDAALRQHAVEPAQIELELTESILMDKVDDTIAVLRDIKALGCTISIDDFGSGYSSLSYLYRFPIDKLKIDRAFIQNMHSAPQNLAVTNAIIGLGHTLGLQVVAEGVERLEDVDLLRAAGCDELQGFYYSRALPAAEAQAWMAAHAAAGSGGRLRRA